MPQRLPALLALAAALGLATASHAQDDAAATTQPAEQTQGAAAEPAAQGAAAEAPAEAQPAPAATGEIDIEGVSYIIGYQTGLRLKQGDVPVNVDTLREGVQAAVEGKEPKLSPEQMESVMQAFQQEMQLRQMAKFQQQAQQGQSFLETNKAKEDVTTTDSGLQYQVLEAGTGASPTAEDTVRVHYRGTLVDGTQFDSSYDRNEPAEFKVNEVIPGWTEALQVMKPGAKYKLVIPPDLAYGASGRPPVIPPNAVLVFDVELLDVVK